ncbi:MAG: HAMP domain-containing histidine kinase [bacterium]|nr:HAMP domain-containing histidine kinase [bacterium]
MNKEITSQPLMVRDFWGRFTNKSLWLIVTYQVLGALIVSGALASVGILELNVIFGIILFAFTIASISVNVLLFELITQPLKDMLAALTQVAGEPTILTPPNPNSRQYTKNGFKPVLQTIYELSSSRGDGSTRPPSKSEVATGLLSQAMDNSSGGFIILNGSQDVAYYNKKAPVHVDKDGKKTIDLIFEDKNDTLETWLKECSESAVHAEKSWQRVASKLPGEDGRNIYDITASYQKGSIAETVITLLNKSDAYAPEEEDLDFIAFAAHELRGPITVIRGYLDVLGDELEPVLEGDQFELLNRLVVSANRLSSYVNNILNASRYDRRHMKIHLVEDTIAKVYDTISDDMQLRSTSQNRMISVNIPDNLPTIAADRGSLSEVMGNLIDNAIKYSNEGGMIQINAHQEDDRVVFEVIDRGIGMPGNVVSNLFHKFYRSHRSRETVAGTGIGLYISKAIVESHGGEISVKSVEGEGSTFAVSLPLYANIADKITANEGLNKEVMNHGTGWIKNHSMYRG